MPFLPVNKEDMNKRGWQQLDFLYISGDAYVDHPSFGHSIITRTLENEGFKVGIIAQPNWEANSDFLRMGIPKYAVLISSGVIDSMVNHYSSGKRPRKTDAYSPGGRVGMRPDRAVIVYANKAREIFKGVPIIIGGLEASLRRFAHYDYWSGKVRRSILLDSKADLLIYGMGELPVIEIAHHLALGVSIDSINDVRGTCRVLNNLEFAQGEFIEVPGFEIVASDKKKYAEAFMIQSQEQDAISGKRLVQQHGSRYLVQNAPSFPMNEEQMDKAYALPYERAIHPSYINQGGIPAISEVEFSLTSHRGCFGGCSFCSINMHQGRIIQKRSSGSLMQEADKLIRMDNFKGYIHDLGGPTANFRNPACDIQKTRGACKDKQCMHPEPCKNLKVDHDEYLSLLRKLRKLPGVKKVFIRSGVRYDYLMLDRKMEFFEELCEYHISGHLKVAPEHVSNEVLNLMGKPSVRIFDDFSEKFSKINKAAGKKQYLVPYFISSHPGSNLAAAVELALYMKERGYRPLQVQDFYPTPGTLSTCMFYTGIDPRNMQEIYIPRTEREKTQQRALMQFWKKENHKYVTQALREAGREELIGNKPGCLVSNTPRDL